MKDPFITKSMIDRKKRALRDLTERRDCLLYKKMTRRWYGLNPFDQKELDEIESGILNVNDQIGRLEDELGEYTI